MRTKLIHFNGNNTNKILYNRFLDNGSSNNENREKMKKIISKAIFDELTEKQRYCLVSHYFEGKKGIQIAEELCVNPSTVSRHLKEATKKLKHIASYYN